MHLRTFLHSEWISVEPVVYSINHNALEEVKHCDVFLMIYSLLPGE
jgi:hypothetical protein